MNRSRRLADTRAEIRSTPANDWWTSNGDAKFGSIAVVRPHRLGEERQFTSRPGGPLDPRPVVEPDRPPAQRPMMSPRTGGARSSMDREVDLVETGHLRHQHPSEQLGETWRHARPDHERHTSAACSVVEVEQCPHVVEFVADRDHGDALLDHRLGDARMGTTLREHDHIDVGAKRLSNPWVVIEDVDPMKHRGQPTTDALPDDTATDDTDSGHHDSGNSSGRQPPCCGGVPPEPRTRRTAATNPIAKMAESARRMTFIASAGYLPSTTARGTDPDTQWCRPVWWG